MAKPRAKTTKGMIVSARLGPPFEAVLADFEIESSKVREQHDWWITNRLTPHIQRRDQATRWKIYLTGMTSQSGTDKYNMGLSKKRALAVETRIRDALPGAHLSFETRWVGESRASPAWEGAIDRAVHVTAQAYFDGQPPPPPPPPPDIPPEPEDDKLGDYGHVQRFRLQVLAYFVGSYKIGSYLRMTINIADELRRKHCYYRLNVGQLGISKGSPIDSHSNKDNNPPNNYFSLRGSKGLELTTADFAGQASVAKYANRLGLQLSPKGTDYPAAIQDLKFKSGFGFSEDAVVAGLGYLNDLSGELGWNEWRDYVDYGRQERLPLPTRETGRRGR